MHDVDEDLRTISAHGGWWNHVNDAGITSRWIIDTPTTSVSNDVASMCRHLRIMFIVIRMIMMSTKTR